MLELLVNAFSDESFSALLIRLSGEFQCAPLELLETSFNIVFIAGFFLACLVSLVIDDMFRYAYRFSRWLFRTLKAQYQKRKEKGR